MMSVKHNFWFYSQKLLTRLGQFFENDATGRFDYRTLLGIGFAGVLGVKFLQTPNPSDVFILCVTGSQVINSYGLNSELIAYIKALAGGYRQPETLNASTYVQADTAPVTGGPVQVTATEVTADNPLEQSINSVS